MKKINKISGHSLAEMLMVIAIISVITSVAIPMMTVKKIGDYDFNTIRCIRQELAKDVNSPACSSSIRDGLNGMSQVTKTLITTADTNGRTSAVNDGSGKSATVKQEDLGNGSEIKVAALKILREICDKGGDEACRFFVEDCKKNLFACDRTEAAVQDLDLNFYLALPRTDTTNIGRMKIVDIASRYYANGVDFQTGAYSNVLNSVETACSDPERTACEIIRKSAKKQVLDFSQFETSDFVQEDGVDGTMFRNGNLTISDKSPFYNYTNPEYFEPFSIKSVPFLVATSESLKPIVYKWSAAVSRLSKLQDLSEGEFFKHVEFNNRHYLFYADGVTIKSYIWNGKEFAPEILSRTIGSTIYKIDTFTSGSDVYLVVGHADTSIANGLKIIILKITSTGILAHIEIPSVSSVTKSFTLLKNGSDIFLGVSNNATGFDTYKWNSSTSSFEDKGNYPAVTRNYLDSFVDTSGNEYIININNAADGSPNNLTPYRWTGAGFNAVGGGTPRPNALSNYASSGVFKIGNDIYYPDATNDGYKSLFTLHKWESGSGFTPQNTVNKGYLAYAPAIPMTYSGNTYLVSGARKSSSKNYIRFLRWNGSGFPNIETNYLVNTTVNNHVTMNRLLLTDIRENNPNTNFPIRWLASFDNKETWGYYSGIIYIHLPEGADLKYKGSTSAEFINGITAFRLTTFTGEPFDLNIELDATDINSLPSVENVVIYYR